MQNTPIIMQQDWVPSNRDELYAVYDLFIAGYEPARALQIFNETLEEYHTRLNHVMPALSTSSETLHTYIELLAIRSQILIDTARDIIHNGDDATDLIKRIHEEEKSLTLLKRSFNCDDNNGIRGADGLPL